MKQARLLFESLEPKKLLSSNSIVAIIDSGAELVLWFKKFLGAE